jgi:glycosyltransferase involved in cell wall biosynthesis
MKDPRVTKCEARSCSRAEDRTKSQRVVRIIHVITRLIVGGSQELVLLTCRDQLRRGHEVVLVYGRTQGPEGSMVGEAKNLAGLMLREVRSMLPDVSIHDWQAYRQVRQLVARHKPDVVHTHTFKAGVLGRYAAARLHVPCVTHTVHGSRFYEEQSRWRNSVVVRSERGAVRQCHRILCVSKALQHRFLAAGIGRPARYRVVYSGLEPGRYQHTATTSSTSIFRESSHTTSTTSRCCGRIWSGWSRVFDRLPKVYQLLYTNGDFLRDERTKR